MPIYEYRCSKCGHELETLQKINDDPLKQCPICKQDSLQKLVSAASFRLKGGGWYETDFKKDNKKHLADSGNKVPDAQKDGKTAGKTSSGDAAGKQVAGGGGKDSGGAASPGGTTDRGASN